ncbi:SIR2-like protein [Modestobacter roseus]|uniref:SIR2-like protein n=3 Tax=Modestobacter roseus TaxID=1181884 RepID=A0A562IM95_9ACTN|nr:SIR2-like protein [Modestobacter roseus]
MDLDTAYRHAQDLFRPGLVTLIGSGLSAASGLPGMWDLAQHLLSSVGSHLTEEGASQWAAIAKRLEQGQGLEEALTTIALTDELHRVLTRQVAIRILESEAVALQEIMQASYDPPLTRLLRHLLRVTDVANVITTNYDRLIEYSAARGAVRVNTMFAGSPFGFLDESESANECRRFKRIAGARQRWETSIVPHVCLSKPHGSLDWYQTGDAGGPVMQSQVSVGDQAPLIVSPGDGKLRLGYETPFDLQRNRANQAIDRASGLLILGFGFNDDHLQVHLKARYSRVPSVILTRDLTLAAHQYLEASSGQSIALSAGAGGSGTELTTSIGSQRISDLNLWQLDTFLREVLAA